MDLPLLAQAVELALLGAAFAVLILLVFQVRLAKKHDALGREVQRLEKAHRDQARDQRTRLEEAAEALAALGDVGPQMRGVAGRVDAFERRLEALAPRLDQIGELGSEAEVAVRQVEGRLARAEDAASEAGEHLRRLETRVQGAESDLAGVLESLERVRETVERRLSRPAPPPLERERPAAPAPLPLPTAAEAAAAAEEAEFETEGALEEISLAEEAPSPVVGPTRLRQEEGDFTFEGEHEDADSSGMRTVLILVVVLAIGTALVHFFVTGR
jgi:ABC-type transporter Mla subunit MlaD